MKKQLLTLTILFLFISYSFSQSSWETITPPVSENFRSVSFINDTTGWIVSDAGTLISTNDGGASWQTNNFQGILESIHFTDENHGCIVGWDTPPADSSFIFMTSDGGNNWSYAPHPNASKLYDVFFINNNIGWTVGFNSPSGWILYTDDAGISWNRQMTQLGVSGELYGVHFRDEDIGNICGVYATFLHTNNGGIIGNGWALNISIPTLGKDLYAIFNFGEMQGCSVGADGIVIYTIDKWANWIQMSSNTDDTLWSVSNAPGTQELWAVGNSGTIIHNQMYIFPWDIQESGVTEDLNDVCMISENEGWAVGDNGTILHFTPAVSISYINEPQIHIYPTPANNDLHIIFDNRNTFYQMQIINTNGKTFISRNIANSNEITLDVSDYPAGIYFLKITTDTKFLVKKILIE